MKSLKNMYILTGNIKKNPDWCLTAAELTTHPQGRLSDILFQSPWPVLPTWAVPPRWIENDPGFPILLRDGFQNRSWPSWFYPPATKLNCEKYSRGFRFEPLLVGKSSSTFDLILVGHNEACSWQQILKKYGLGNEVYWIWNGPGQPLVSWPLKYLVNYHEVLHGRLSKGPKRLIDCSFRISDTYTVLHLVCLQNGSQLIHDESFKQVGQLIDKRETFYGSWQIFRF